MDDPKDKKAAVTPLTPVQKQQWNLFQDYMQKNGLAGNPALDDRNKGLGQYYFQQFAAHTPGFSLTYQDVPRVQQELQDYRANLVNQYKAGKIAPSDDIKSEADIMGNLSPVDSWLGSKTSSSRFPVATATNSQGQTTNYGTDVSAFDQARGLNK